MVMCRVYRFRHRCKNIKRPAIYFSNTQMHLQHINYWLKRFWRDSCIINLNCHTIRLKEMWSSWWSWWLLSPPHGTCAPSCAYDEGRVTQEPSCSGTITTRYSLIQSAWLSYPFTFNDWIKNVCSTCKASYLLSFTIYVYRTCRSFKCSLCLKMWWEMWYHLIICMNKTNI